MVLHSMHKTLTYLKSVEQFLSHEAKKLSNYPLYGYLENYTSYQNN